MALIEVIGQMATIDGPGVGATWLDVGLCLIVVFGVIVAYRYMPFAIAETRKRVHR